MTEIEVEIDMKADLGREGYFLDLAEVIFFSSFFSGGFSKSSSKRASMNREVEIPSVRHSFFKLLHNSELRYRLTGPLSGSFAFEIILSNF